MRIIVLSLVMLAFAPDLVAQRMMTRTGHIFFKSNAKIDDGVEANNESVACVLDASKGTVAFQVLITAFQFEKALMQEHFNENYLESDQFPKSTFSGQIQNWETIDPNSPGTHEVEVTGELTIHGVTQKVAQTGTLEVLKDGSIQMKTHMLIPLADYNIAIPSVVADKIAKEIDVDIDVVLKG